MNMHFGARSFIVKCWDPDHIVASSVRSVDGMVYNEVKALVDGTWEPGLHMNGMKGGAVNCDTEGIFNIENCQMILKLQSEK